QVQTCFVAPGTSADCNSNGVPDECELEGNDCNNNAIPDDCDIASGRSADCNGNGVPDECDIASGTSRDCNENGVPDECDIASGTSRDCNTNGVPDECDIASGTSDDANSNGVPDECEAADVAVTKSASPNPVFVGQPLTYTIVVTNNGPQPTTATLTDVLPAGVSFVSASTGCSEVSGTVTCAVGPLAAGQATTVTIVVVPNTTGTIVNRAVVAGGAFDPVPGNNQTPDVETQVRPLADLSITKTASTNRIFVGQPLTYTITVSNAGPSPATNVTMTDILPPSALFVSASTGCSEASGTVTCNLGTIAAGGSKQVQIVVIPQTTATLHNTAVVTGDDSDPDTTDNQTPVVTTAVDPSADLMVDKSLSPLPAPVGQTLTYTIVVTNMGPSNATSVTVVDNVPPQFLVGTVTTPQGTVTTAPGVVIWDLGVIASGTSLSLTLTGVTTQPTTLVNVVTVLSVENDPDGANDTDTEVTDTCWPIVTEIDDIFTTNVIEPIGSVNGWWSFGFNTPGFADTYFESTAPALASRVYASTPDRFRVSGLYTNFNEWLPYSSVGPTKYVRGQYYLYGTGNVNLPTTVTMPNLRVRLTNRFAVNSMLEVFTHLNGDPEGTSLGRELRPSLVPSNPSVYTVDFDPVDVPFLVANAATEGIARAFEAYALDPQDNGVIAMVESLVYTYPKTLLTTAAQPLKVYEPFGGTAGSLGVVFPASELAVYNLALSPLLGQYGTIEDDGSTTLPTYSEGPWGITMDSTLVPDNRVGIVSREFFPGGDLTKRVRVRENKQYVIRWHITSTQQSNLNSMIRLRARSAKFMWGQKYELGGAWATGRGEVTNNNAIAQQALPGIGTQNPDRYTTDTVGGWYTMHFHTPLDRRIRPEFAPADSIETRMPILANQPGPGVNAPSRRDIILGADLVDTLSPGVARIREKGNFTIDRIEIREYDLLREDEACIPAR
ncbi:MAG: DUF11 domain-containing protein, partial [Candidatus Sumerlaeaceae bacterium]|nr:DUF11 domain-containing protein [Candidatus Sumerlaeaceae bacterium]